MKATQKRNALSIGSFLLLVSPFVFAQDQISERVALARSAAPAAISAEATVIVDGKVMVEGTNGWTCMPDTMPGDRAAMCNDATWMRLMNAVGTAGSFETDRIGISYMLQGEPTGSGVSNATPYHSDPQSAEDYVQTGPHLMIVVPREMLQGISRSPDAGGPFVMWGDTPYAHIMVPITD